jgi:nitrogen fixation protein NifX
MKVAIATQDLARIDAHLGWARHLMFYEVSAEGWAYLGLASFDVGLVQDGDHGKLAPRLAALQGCALVFIAAVGPEGEGQLARARITPMRGFAGQPVAVALDSLSQGLRGRPPAWLRQCEQEYRRREVSVP